jgi:hypothetical protein
MKTWKITFMTDYPYSGSHIVNAKTEKSAWKKFEKETGVKRDEYCSIKKLD